MHITRTPPSSRIIFSYQGTPTPRRHGGSISEAMKEANHLKAANFAAFFGGEPDPRNQKICCEVLDHARQEHGRLAGQHCHTIRQLGTDRSNSGNFS